MSDAAAEGIEVSTPLQSRQETSAAIETVKRELGISLELEKRWRRWVDDEALWPDFPALVHGDLYAGHVLSDSEGNVSGVIDWSEARMSDPSIDFSGHLAVFGEESLRELIDTYANGGGVVWERMFEQARERHAASPLKYAIFALRAGLDDHIDAARAQLGGGL